MMSVPGGEILTTSELISGQQYVLISAVDVQLREARPPVAAAPMRKKDLIISGVLLDQRSCLVDRRRTGEDDHLKAGGESGLEFSIFIRQNMVSRAKTR